MSMSRWGWTIQNKSCRRDFSAEGTFYLLLFILSPVILVWCAHGTDTLRSVVASPAALHPALVSKPRQTDYCSVVRSGTVCCRKQQFRESSAHDNGAFFVFYLCFFFISMMLQRPFKIMLLFKPARRLSICVNITTISRGKVNWLACEHEVSGLLTYRLLCGDN